MATPATEEPITVVAGPSPVDIDAAGMSLDQLILRADSQGLDQQGRRFDLDLHFEDERGHLDLHQNKRIFELRVSQAERKFDLEMQKAQAEEERKAATFTREEDEKAETARLIAQEASIANDLKKAEAEQQAANLAADSLQLRWMRRVTFWTRWGYALGSFGLFATFFPPLVTLLVKLVGERQWVLVALLTALATTMLGFLIQNVLRATAAPSLQQPDSKIAAAIVARLQPKKPTLTAPTGSSEARP